MDSSAPTDRRLGQRAARGALGTLLAQTLILSIRVGSIVGLARFISVESFAVVAIGVAFATLSSSVVTMGIPMAVLQAPPLSDSARFALTLVNFGLGAAIAIGFVLCSAPLAAAYSMPELANVLLALSLVPLATGISAQSRAQLLVDLRFGLVSLYEASGVVVGAVVALSLAVNGAQHEALVAQAVLSTLLPSVAFLIHVRPRKAAVRGSLVAAKPILRSAKAIFATNIVRNVTRSSLVPVMGAYVPAAALGAFDRAQQLAVLPINMVADQLQRVVVPTLTRVREDEPRLLSMLTTGQTLLSLMMSASYLSLAPVAIPLTMFALGNEWKIAGELLAILAVGAVFRSLAQTAQWLYLATGNAEQALRFNIKTQPVILVVSLLGIPWGVQGVAVANTVAWACLWPCAVYSTSRLVKASAWNLAWPSLRAVITIGFPAGTVSFAAQVLVTDEMMALTLSLVCSFLTVLLMITISRHWRSELARAKRLIVR